MCFPEEVTINLQSWDLDLLSRIDVYYFIEVWFTYNKSHLFSVFGLVCSDQCVRLAHPPPQSGRGGSPLPPDPSWPQSDVGLLGHCFRATVGPALRVRCCGAPWAGDSTLGGAVGPHQELEPQLLSQNFIFLPGVQFSMHFLCEPRCRFPSEKFLLTGFIWTILKNPWGRVWNS